MGAFEFWGGGSVTKIVEGLCPFSELGTWLIHRRSKTKQTVKCCGNLEVEDPVFLKVFKNTGVNLSQVVPFGLRSKGRELRCL